jgi:sodium-dependent dicarboxylate transporter 2/3/5
MNAVELSEVAEPGPGVAAVRVGAWLTPVVFLALWFAPLPLSTEAHRLAAIAGAVLVAWVTEVVPIAVTATLIGPAMVLAGVTTAKKAFAPYADPILFLFVGSFLAARAMQRHGLDRRFAHAVVSLRAIAGRPARVRAAFLVTAIALSMWISNTGTCAILLPVVLGAVAASSAKSPFVRGSLLALAHGSTVGGFGTLVGTPPNAITARILAEAGHPIGFGAWMGVGVPVMLALGVVLYVVCNRMFPPGEARVEAAASGAMSETAPALRGGASDETAPALRGGASLHTPWSRAEKATALSFALAVIGWIVPDLAKLFALPGGDKLADFMDPGAVAVVAASLLFTVPTAPGGPRVLVAEDVGRIDWGLILLFGGGIALGEQMFATGLAAKLGDGLIALTGVRGLWSLTALAIVLSIVLTEICSNTASANMLVPLVIGVALALGVSPIPPALGVGIGASCGFMLPVATGPNALVYGTGLVSARDMIKLGIWLDLSSAVVVWLLLRLLCPLYGWT